jgi:hypothetical protein
MCRLLSRFSPLLLMLSLCFGAAQPRPGRADDEEVCRVVAEVTVFGVEQGAFAACVVTRHPVACAISAAAESVAVQEVAKEGITRSCTWSVKRIKDRIRIEIEAPADKAEELRETYRNLCKAKSLRFLKKSF